ncbi:MAG TPA: Ku protein [Candidatus Polarisedimenticolaceae bacterium]|nr:Ku protein [Candidatus Polarisedimenticolaceae bacterium]
MSARAISSAMVSFGLVSIPVKVYSSGEASSGIHFNMLHKKCGSRLKQQYVCAQDGERVERAEMVRGYEFAKGQYVLFSDEELKALQQKADQQIEITEFLPTDKVDPIYFENSYYLGPDKGGDRAYRLLTQALRKSGRSALAKYATRGKQYLVLLRPVEQGLVMQQLRYATEIRSISEIPLGDAQVKPAELDLAMQIIEQAISERFDPASYEDEVRKRMLSAIERKVEGHEITEEPTEEPKAQVIDLMQALKASLSGGTARKPSRRAPPKPAATTKAKKKTTAKKSRTG